MASFAQQGQPAEGAPPIDAATLYPEDDGFFGRRAKARRAKQVAALEGVLRTALAPGERIRYVARGCRYSFAEYFFSGNSARYHNLVALVLTDRRLLVLHVTPRGKPADIKLQIPLAELRSSRTWFISGWKLTLADGTKPAFTNVPGKDRKRLDALLAPAPGTAPAPPAPAPRAGGEASLQNLCPGCLQPVPGKTGATLICPNPACRIPFRDPRRAARLSAFMPGLGDLYLRHHLFGSLELLGSALMLGLALAFALAASLAPTGAALSAAAVMLGLFVVAPRVIDYFITLHMGRKGLVPLALAPAPGAQPRNLPSFPRWSPLLFAAAVALAAVVVVGLYRDLRQDSEVEQAGRLAAAGRHEEAFARWAALRTEGVSEEKKVKFALALLEAGDLEGMDEVRESFQEKPIEEALAKRWNGAIERHAALLADYEQGVKALAEGDAAGLERLDRALAYFAKAKRPHLPASRAEVHAHVAARVLAPPVVDADLEGAHRWVDGARGAPAAEEAVVRAAFDSWRGEPEAARAALAGADLASTPPDFRLLALETRARVAATEADREEVRKAAGTFPRGPLSEEDVQRLDALAGAAR